MALPTSYVDGDLVTAAAMNLIGTTVNANTAALTTTVDKTVINAKGDLFVGTADNTLTRVATGADGTTLLADSSQAAGLRWGAAATSSYADPLSTPGDIVVRGSSATTRKAVGGDGQVLAVNLANADKLQYITLTKTLVGLSNVDNTSDATKPVSTLQAAADTAAVATATGRAVAFSVTFGG